MLWVKQGQVGQTYIGNPDGGSSRACSVGEAPWRVPSNRAIIAPAQVMPGPCLPVHSADHNVVQFAIAIGIGKVNILRNNPCWPVSNQCGRPPGNWQSVHVLPPHGSPIVVHVDVVIKAVSVQAVSWLSVRRRRNLVKGGSTYSAKRTFSG